MIDMKNPFTLLFTYSSPKGINSNSVSKIDMMFTWLFFEWDNIVRYFFQIEVIADVEGVGQNYQDHYGVQKLKYKYKNYKESTINFLRLITGLPSYKTTPKGMCWYVLYPTTTPYFHL